MGGVFTESLDSYILKHLTNSPHFLLQVNRKDTSSIAIYMNITLEIFYSVTAKNNLTMFMNSKIRIIKSITIIDIFFDEETTVR